MIFHNATALSFAKARFFTAIDKMKTRSYQSWPSTLRSLQHRDFRILWTGLIISAIGTWMQIVAQSLLVLRLTHGSAFALGIVSLAQAAAFFLFALAGGGFADRLDRRRLLLGTQSLLMCFALIMGLLTVTGIIQVWMIVIFAFLSGSILSFDQPARAALISSLVPKEDLLNAISLQSAVFNGAATLGPALAGITVAAIGLPANFFLNALSFLAVLLGLLWIRPPKAILLTHRASLITQVREGLGTVKRDAVLPWLLLGYGVLLFCGPSLPLLLPVLATRNLRIGPTILGLLFSAAGVGSVLGAVFLASVPEKTNKSRLMFSAFAFWTGGLVLVGVSPAVMITFAALVVFGMSQSVIGAMTSTLLQTRVPHEQRGRVTSLNTLLIMGVRPLGDFPAGAFISLFGAPASAATSAAIVGLIALVLFVRRPVLRSF
jgi:MFS family permease